MPGGASLGPVPPWCVYVAEGERAGDAYGAHQRIRPPASLPPRLAPMETSRHLLPPSSGGGAYLRWAGRGHVHLWEALPDPDDVLPRQQRLADFTMAASSGSTVLSTLSFRAIHVCMYSARGTAGRLSLQYGFWAYNGPRL